MISLELLLKDEQLIHTWKRFFEENYKSELEDIALKYPDVRSIIVDYWTIDKFSNGNNLNLSDLLINQPHKAIFNAEMAIREIDTVSDKSMKLHVRIKNLEDINKIRIRDKNSLTIGKLVCISGVIRKRTNPKPKIIVACFICSKCGAPIKVSQEDSILREPAECYEDQSGCGRVSTFKLSTGLSTFLDEMKIEVQEYNGYDLLAMRVFIKDPLGKESLPSRKGLTVRTRMIPELLKAIQEAESICKEAGLLGKEETE